MYQFAQMLRTNKGFVAVSNYPFNGNKNDFMVCLDANKTILIFHNDVQKGRQAFQNFSNNIQPTDNTTRIIQAFQQYLIANHPTDDIAVMVCGFDSNGPVLFGVTQFSSYFINSFGKRLTIEKDYIFDFWFC
jgi:hypothetical protein